MRLYKINPLYNSMYSNYYAIVYLYGREVRTIHSIKELIKGPYHVRKTSGGFQIRIIKNGDVKSVETFVNSYNYLFCKVS